MNILITGGAGFIGSNIVEYLCKEKLYTSIRILDNLSTGKYSNIEPFLTQYDNLEFMHGNITNLETCRKAVQGIDLICHQAALGSVPRSLADPLASHISNVNGFLNILIAAKEHKIKRIVYASSSSVYGDHPVLPKVEENTGNLLSPYAATKAIDEIYAGVFTRCYDMECIGLRYFNVFGPRQDPNGAYAAVIPKFIQLMKAGKQPTIHGDGSFSRDFTYIDNVVQANILALTTTNKECFGTAFNIGAGGQTSILDMVHTINTELKTNIQPILGPNRPGDIPHSHADITKAKRLLGYEPEIAFNEGMNYTIKYYSKRISPNILLEDIDYNKLLNRKPIQVDLSNIKKYLYNKQILITGGCGSIGSEIVRQIIQLKNHNIIIYDNNEYSMFNFQNELRSKYNIGISSHSIQLIIGDIRDKEKLIQIFNQNKIDIVFHAAAYKHVPLMEHNPDESIKTNIIGTKNIADICLQYKVHKFIMISTDKVVKPTNIMGVCKRIAELYINNLNNKTVNTQFITTRFGNVLGSNGSVIPTFLNKINSNEDLQLTHKDITRYFMTIPEAAQLVLYSSFIGQSGEILLFDMGKPVKIYDLAKKMIKLYGNDNIGININGLRPGEKLYEELLCIGENIIPTDNKLIMKLKHDNTIDYTTFFYNFKKIIKFEYSNISELKHLFKNIVHDYKPY